MAKANRFDGTNGNGYQPVATGRERSIPPGPECPPFDRAPETSRRTSAVELLLSMGYRWCDGAWMSPKGCVAIAWVQPQELERLQSTGEEMIYRDKLQDDFVPVYMPRTVSIDVVSACLGCDQLSCHACFESHANEQGYVKSAALGDVENLKRFVALMFKATDWPDGGDVDGFEFQRIAEQCGLLKEVLMNESCGENCQCEEMGADFPAVCYRKTQLYRDCVAAIGKGEEVANG